MRRTGVVPDVAGLTAGDHVCLTYTSVDEFRRVLGRYFGGGLTAGDRLVFFGSPEQIRLVRDQFTVDGHDVDILLDRGQLLLDRADDGYLVNGELDIEARIEASRTLVAQALADGYPALRAAGDLTFLLDSPALAGYELAADLLAVRLPLIGLCCYDAIRATPELGLIDAVHPLHVAPAHTAGPPGFALYAHQDGSLHLRGEVDFRYAEAIRAILHRGARLSGVDILDVSGLGFVDGAGIRAIAHAVAALGGARRRMRIRGAGPAFRTAWLAAGFDPLITAAEEAT